VPASVWQCRRLRSRCLGVVLEPVDVGVVDADAGRQAAADRDQTVDTLDKVRIRPEDLALFAGRDRDRITDVFVGPGLKTGDGRAGQFDFRRVGIVEPGRKRLGACQALGGFDEKYPNLVYERDGSGGDQVGLSG
jgi:hypothetical protein